MIADWPVVQAWTGPNDVALTLQAGIFVIIKHHFNWLLFVFQGISKLVHIIGDNILSFKAKNLKCLSSYIAVMIFSFNNEAFATL